MCVFAHSWSCVSFAFSLLRGSLPPQSYGSMLGTVQLSGPYLLRCNFAISIGNMQLLGSYLFHCNSATLLHICDGFTLAACTFATCGFLCDGCTPQAPWSLPCRFLFCVCAFAFHIHTCFCATCCLILALLQLSLSWLSTGFRATCRCVPSIAACLLHVSCPCGRYGEAMAVGPA